jgi:hypothetical protein
MKRNFLSLFVIVFLFCNLTLAETPKIRIEISEDIEYCESCREHGMDGWNISFRLLNLSDKTVLVSGFWIRDLNNNKFTDPNYFFPDNFDQTLFKSDCKWNYNGKNAKPAWAEKSNFSKDETLKIPPMGFYEFNTRIGWGFDGQHFSRKIFFVSFENEDKFYEIHSPAFFLIRNNTNNFAKVIIEDNPCKQY